jgi:uncharacterized membrane protein SirB2
MTYLTVKYLHVLFAILSGAFFLARGILMLRQSDVLQQKWIRIAPHVIDTLLLAFAVVLALWSSQYPGQQAWLTAKVMALILYIFLGTIALKRARSRTVRLAAFIAALVTFAYIAAVALTRNPGVLG